MLKRPPGKSLFVGVIANIPHNLTRNTLDINFLEVLAGNLTRIDNKLRRAHRLARHMRILVLFQASIQHRIRNLVRNFIRMPFRDGFRSENMSMPFQSGFHILYYIILGTPKYLNHLL